MDDLRTWLEKELEESLRRQKETFEIEIEQLKRKMERM